MAPDKIFLQVCGSCDLKVTCENCEFAKLLDGGEVTWSEGRIYEKDEEYIRKDALLEFAKEKQEQMKIEAGGCSNMLAAGKYLAYSELIEKIESL